MMIIEIIKTTEKQYVEQIATTIKQCPLVFAERRWLGTNSRTSVARFRKFVAQKRSFVAPKRKSNCKMSAQHIASRFQQ